MIDADELKQERERFFVVTHGSIYLPLFGIAFWPALGIAGYLLSPVHWGLLVLVLVVLALPIAAVLLTVLIKQLSLTTPLAKLIFPALAPLLMSFGITVPVYLMEPALTPLPFVIGLALHWPVFAWLYNQPLFTVHCVLRILIATSIALFIPAHLFTWLPISMGFLYLLTAIWIFTALRRMKASEPQPK